MIARRQKAKGGGRAEIPMNMRTMALAVLLAALPLADAFATTWIVTGTGEPATIASATCDLSNNCPTLRDAINSAALSGDTIQFSTAIDGQTILLSLYGNDLGTSTRTSSQFGPSAFFFTGGKSLTIDGKTGLRLGITIARDTTAPFRLFDIDVGSGLTLQGLTLKNGLAQGFSSDFGGGALGAGGAIFNQGTVSIDSCTFTGNAAQGGASGDSSGNYGGAGVGSAPPASNGGGPNGGVYPPPPMSDSAAAVMRIRQAVRVDLAVAAAKAERRAAPVDLAVAAVAVQMVPRQAAATVAAREAPRVRHTRAVAAAPAWAARSSTTPAR
ncbi:MAG: hypothetical protein KGP08_09790 [Xanthomonadaceae bacterium]|nr:hypothetical protein [Xanthomonadaceae bacterium]